MKSIKLWFIALVLVLVTAALASAALVEYQGTTYIGVTNQNQPLTKVVVGAADVPISSFGVYGQAVVNTNLKWLIFDSTQLTSPVYLSTAQTVPGKPGTFADQAQWYVSPEIEFTLLAGHTYAMGVIANQVGASSFRWGLSADAAFPPRPDTVGDGLTIKFMQSLDNSGLVGSAFINTPYIYSIDNSNRRKMSLQVFDPPPVPIPPSALLFGSGLVGLLAVGRRRFFKK